MIFGVIRLRSGFILNVLVALRCVAILPELLLGGFADLRIREGLHRFARGFCPCRFFLVVLDLSGLTEGLPSADDGVGVLGGVCDTGLAYW
jgi:hypothetical protein